jgi:hypothetical protein
VVDVAAAGGADEAVLLEGADADVQAASASAPTSIETEVRR